VKAINKVVAYFLNFSTNDISDCCRSLPCVPHSERKRCFIVIFLFFFFPLNFFLVFLHIPCISFGVHKMYSNSVFKSLEVDMALEKPEWLW